MTGIVLGLLFPLGTIATPGEGRRASDVLNDLMPGLITVAVCGVWLAMTLMGRTTPDLLNAMVQITIAFFFGQHTSMAAARKIIAAVP